MLLRKFYYGGVHEVIAFEDISGDFEQQMVKIKKILRLVEQGHKVKIVAERSKIELFWINSNVRLVIDGQTSVVIEDERVIFRLLAMAAANVHLMVILLYIGLLAKEKSLMFDDGEYCQFNHVLGLGANVINCNPEDVALSKQVMPDHDDGDTEVDWFDLFDLNFDVHRQRLTDWMIFNYLYVLLPEAARLKGPEYVNSHDLKVLISSDLGIIVRGGKASLFKKSEDSLFTFRDCEGLIEAIILAEITIRSSYEVEDFYAQPEWYVYKILNDRENVL